jgi:hypothetical protein
MENNYSSNSVGGSSLAAIACLAVLLLLVIAMSFGLMDEVLCWELGFCSTA